MKTPPVPDLNDVSVYLAAAYLAERDYQGLAELSEKNLDRLQESNDPIEL